MQAETLARVLAHAGDDQLVTKAGFSALKADFTALKADLSGEIAALKGRLIKELSLLRADTIRWLVTAIGFKFLATQD